MNNIKVFKLCSDEYVLKDDYPIHPDYVYIVDGIFTKYNGWESSTVGVWKLNKKIKEVRRCSLFAHEGARIGDRASVDGQ